MPKQTFFEGQTATNPQTGQRIVFQRGKWVPMGAGGVAPPPKLAEQEQKALIDARDQAQSSLDTATAAERFVKLNQKQATGPIMGLPWLPLPKFIGESPTIGGTFVKPFSPAYQEMESIVSAIGPKQRPPGSGSSSDKDTALYLRGVPGVTNLGSANQEIYNRLKDESTKKAARASFLDTWAQKRGTLLGADEAFAKFWAQREQSQRGSVPPAGGSRAKYLGTE